MAIASLSYTTAAFSVRVTSSCSASVSCSTCTAAAVPRASLTNGAPCADSQRGRPPASRGRERSGDMGWAQGVVGRWQCMEWQ